MDPEKFFFRFPEGEYEIEGVTLEGEELESSVFVSHVLPAPPANITVSDQGAPEDCDAATLPIVKRNTPLVISWDPVTGNHPEIGKAVSEDDFPTLKPTGLE